MSYEDDLAAWREKYSRKLIEQKEAERRKKHPPKHPDVPAPATMYGRRPRSTEPGEELEEGAHIVRTLCKSETSDVYYIKKPSGHSDSMLGPVVRSARAGLKMIDHACRGYHAAATIYIYKPSGELHSVKELDYRRSS